MGRRERVSTKPSMVDAYNKHMGGIDKADHLLSYYLCETKTIRWYLKLRIYFLQIIMIHSFILYQRFSGKRVNLLEYRDEIIKS